MVCAKCEKKLSKLAPAAKWKDGADNKGTSSGRKINENKALSKKKQWSPYTRQCKVCKSALQPDYHYCQKCAYIKGLCAMCGKQVRRRDDLSGLEQSSQDMNLTFVTWHLAPVA